MMKANKPMAALFDLDGVVFDTETQYSIFWGGQGRKYHPGIPGFDHLIKGTTLTHIFESYFPDKALQEQLTRELDEFERTMPYDYIPGIEDFLQDLRNNGVHTAVVTSSNQTKMQSVREAHPELDSLFDRVLTSEDFAASKPDPDCYLLGARVFDAPLENCMVFEDSFNGLKAGMAAGICTVGLATTNPADAIRDFCHYVMDDFRNFSYKEMCNLLNR